MYSAFDPYLARSTWHTGHPNDDSAFYDCLSEVVNDSEFHPDSMGKYMRQQKNVDADDHNGAFAQAINDRVTEAWAIKGYLARHGA